MAETESTPDSRPPFWSRYRWALTAVAALLVFAALFLAFCDRDPSADIRWWTYNARENKLMLFVNDCGGSYASGAYETDEVIEVWIYTLHPRDTDLRCGDNVEIQLYRPFENRAVIDGRTGDPIPEFRQ